MKDYIVDADSYEFAVKASTRRTALAAVLLEMLRTGRISLISYDAENVARWSVQEVK